MFLPILLGKCVPNVDIIQSILVKIYVKNNSKGIFLVFLEHLNLRPGYQRITLK